MKRKTLRTPVGPLFVSAAMRDKIDAYHAREETRIGYKLSLQAVTEKLLTIGLQSKGKK